MTTLHQFSVLVDFPDRTDVTAAESAIADAIDVYCKERGMTHATTLLSATPGMTTTDLLAAIGKAASS
jgi:hypothetical protein